MTWLGYTFWGLCLLGIITGYYFQKKSGAKAIDKEYDQTLDQQIRRYSINDRPKKF
ncbi:hypothetical protein [Bacillus sp. EAC]|uniref:hypothetical protein n=1 Tax=Bacillus sp. EAC TaxID=1978338 RepID=UPI0015C5206B|nr:hypothetical protein [Bacillus sp. EAC]